MSDDPWERAASLENAVLHYGDAERVARYEALRKSTSFKLPGSQAQWLESPTEWLRERDDYFLSRMQEPLSAAIERKEALWRALVQDLIGKLRSGELIAQGIQSPATLDSEPTAIPAHLWRLLRPDLRDSS